MIHQATALCACPHRCSLDHFSLFPRVIILSKDLFTFQYEANSEWELIFLRTVLSLICSSPKFFLIFYLFINAFLYHLTKNRNHFIMHLTQSISGASKVPYHPLYFCNKIDLNYQILYYQILFSSSLKIAVNSLRQ